MDRIDIFYQLEATSGVEHFEAGPGEPFKALKGQLTKKHNLAGDYLLFVEDEDHPADEKRRLRDAAGAEGIVKLHLHRCPRIAVSVTFNNETVNEHFGPGATIAKIKRWAAEQKFGMGADEAGEHVLQIAGTQDRPSAGTHIGTLTVHPACKVAFDLVPDERINGWAGGAQ